MHIIIKKHLDLFKYEKCPGDIMKICAFGRVFNI